MRAALLLIPSAALAAAAVAAVGLQKEEAMDMGNDVLEMDAAPGNSTEAAAPSPAWMAGRTWLYAAEEEEGAVWYFEALDSDFTVSPHRVLLRIDHRPDPNRTHDNSERLAEIDCAAHRYRILGTTHYDDSGRATPADERGEGRLVPIVPGSVLAGVEAAVCRHAPARLSAEIDGR
jgi:hypothetical protein